jgi:hypothetical protein
MRSLPGMLQGNGLHRRLAGGAVLGVLAGHGGIDRSGILHRVRERADLIEAAGEGDEPIAADASIGGLEADSTRERGRLADGTAGIATERGMYDACSDACCRTATGLPPGTFVGSIGFLTLPKALFSLLLPMANSSQLVRPRITASAASKRSTTVALYKRGEAFQDARSCAHLMAL